MRGERTGETYRLGDKVQVKLVEAAPVAGALRFELTSQGRYTGKTHGAKKGAKKARGSAKPTKPAKETRRSPTRVKVKRRSHA
jgi:ribonuclease R